MAESVTIARPYAEAIFRIAKAGGTLSQWSARLKQLALVVQDPGAIELIASPLVSSDQVTSLFVSLVDQADQDVSSFLHLLAENGRLTFLPEISALFDVAKNDEEGIKNAVVESAFPLNDDQVAALLPTLEEYFGKKLATSVRVEPELIGGVRVTVGDQILDTSVRSKLEAMASALKN